jgi:hypothetical protein
MEEGRRRTGNTNHKEEKAETEKEGRAGGARIFFLFLIKYKV